MGRSVLLWALLKVVLAPQVGSWVFLFPVSLGMSMAVGALMLLDLRIFRDRVFMANLGIPRRSIVAVGVLVAIALEVACSLFLPPRPPVL
jgi:hypothetical protein